MAAGIMVLMEDERGAGFNGGLVVGIPLLVAVVVAFLPGEVILYSLAGNMLANEVLKIMLDLPGILDGKVLKFDIAAYQSSIETL